MPAKAVNIKPNAATNDISPTENGRGSTGQTRARCQPPAKTGITAKKAHIGLSQPAKKITRGSAR